MTANVLMRPDPKGRSFAFALALHGSLFGAILLVNWLNANGPRFGDPNAGGASIGVEAVDKIPLPHTGRPNPLAAQTENEAPQEPAKPEDKAQKDVVPPDAVKLNLHKDKKPQAKEESVKRRVRSFDQLESTGGVESFVQPDAGVGARGIGSEYDAGDAVWGLCGTDPAPDCRQLAHQ
jgi:hypothetical protein